MAEIIEMPKLSDTMTTGTLVKWLKKEGDEVAAGDMIAEVETDKATMEVENFEDGVILKLYTQEGDSVDVGAPICAVGEKGESVPEAESSSSSTPTDEKKEESPKEKAKEEPKEEETADLDKKTEKPSLKANDSDDDRIKASPLARKIAKEKGLDLSQIEGTGPNGRILKGDVLNAKPQAARSNPSSRSAPLVSGDFIEAKEEKVSNMRASIAKALVKSKQESPHFYLQTVVDSKALIDLRKHLNAKLSELPPEQGGAKFTVNDLILKASAEAVRRVPAINRSWHGDKIVQHGGVQLAFGVAIDDGLLTPVIRDAHAKPLRQISVEAKGLIEKARNRKLKPDEMSGSTLTVTNLGMFGITEFYGIINPPNAAILSIGATTEEVVVGENGEFKVGYRMKVGLSGDHRVIDGAVGAQYLAALREILETPSTMLV